MRRLPKTPTGNSAEASHARQLAAVIRSSQPVMSPGVLTDYTTRGTRQRAKQRAGRGGPGGDDELVWQ
jgi:hypothetical protein